MSFNFLEISDLGYIPLVKKFGQESNRKFIFFFFFFGVMETRRSYSNSIIETRNIIDRLPLGGFSLFIKFNYVFV